MKLRKPLKWIIPAAILMHVTPLFGQTQLLVSGRTIDKDNPNTGTKTELTFYPKNGQVKTFSTDANGNFSNTVTGIEGEQGKSPITFYGNNNKIFTTGINGNTWPTLILLSGQEFSIPISSNGTIELPHLAAGMYGIRFENEKLSYTKFFLYQEGTIYPKPVESLIVKGFQKQLTTNNPQRELFKTGNSNANLSVDAIADSIVIKGMKGEKTVLKNVALGNFGNIPVEVYETINMTELMYWQQPDSSAIKNQDITFTGPITKTLKTDINGKIITNLPAGTYTITTDPQKIWTPPNTTVSPAGKTGLDTVIYAIEYKGLDADNIEMYPHTKKMSRSELKLMQITHTDDRDNNIIYKFNIDPKNVSGTTPTWYMDITTTTAQNNLQLMKDRIKKDYSYQKSPRFPNGWGEPKIITGTTPPQWFTAEHENVIPCLFSTSLPDGYIAANSIKLNNEKTLIRYGQIEYLSNLSVAEIKFAQPHEDKSVIEGARGRADFVTINNKQYFIKSILNIGYRDVSETEYFKTDEKISTLHNYLLPGTSIKLPY